jgi:hypothetical protein
LLSSRALPPLVIGFFFLFYVVLAFFTEETLTALMGFTRGSIFLVVLLALLPLNGVLRLVKETDVFLKRHRALSGALPDAPAELYDETVSLPVCSPIPDPGYRSPSSEGSPAAPAFAGLQSRLAAVGYKTCRTNSVLTAWRGISIFPARLLFLAATCCLFVGILVSLTTRSSQRWPVIEGEPFPMSAEGGMVERITLAKSDGPLLDKTLTVVVSPSNSDEGRRVFGLYPPALFDGSFVYPRYLGIALLLRLSVPHMPEEYELHCIPNIYPPGKEDSVEISGSPYRVVLSMAQPDMGTDPYVTGHITIVFKLLKGKEVLITGSAPVGGEFSRDGYRLAFPDSRRMAITDFIRDRGVLLVWAASLLFMVSGCIWLPVRVFFPRREMRFSTNPNALQAFSRAEGRGRSHAGIFHEALDLLERQPSYS